MLWAERSHVVLDEGDSRECAEEIGALHDIHQARVVVRLSPPINHRSLPRDVLRALGKRLELPESPRLLDDASDLAGVWLAAENIRHVYFLRAHLLSVDTVRQILLMTGDLTDIWFVAAAARTPSAITDGMQPSSAHKLDVRTFDEVRGELRHPFGPEADEAGPWPPVPDDEFWFFRARAREVLSDADFARIDGDFLIGHFAAYEWIHQRARALILARFKQSEIEAFFTGLLTPVTARAQAVARVRGAQAAFFLCGTLVELPATAFANSRINGSMPLDPRAVKLLRGFSSPRLAAAGALSLGCQLPPADLCAVTIAGLGPESEHATVAANRFPIAPNARGLVRAQRLALQADNLRPNGALFPAQDDPSSAMSTKRMYELLKRISRSTGLALLPDRVGEDLRVAGPAPWLLPGALTVSWLESLGRSEARA